MSLYANLPSTKSKGNVNEETTEEPKGKGDKPEPASFAAFSLIPPSVLGRGRPAFPTALRIQPTSNHASKTTTTASLSAGRGKPLGSTGFTSSLPLAATANSGSAPASTSKLNATNSPTILQPSDRSVQLSAGRGVSFEANSKINYSSPFVSDASSDRTATMIIDSDKSSRGGLFEKGQRDEFESSSEDELGVKAHLRATGSHGEASDDDSSHEHDGHHDTHGARKILKGHEPRYPDSGEIIDAYDPRRPNEFQNLLNERAMSRERRSQERQLNRLREQQERQQQQLQQQQQQQQHSQLQQHNISSDSALQSDMLSGEDVYLRRLRMTQQLNDAQSMNI